MSEGDNVNNKNVDLNELEFCVFDLETTGGNHSKDGIIEIGIVIIKNKKIIEEKNYLINPKQKIPDFIQKLTSISDKDVENAPTIEEVIDQILDFMGDRILVAHNTSFDVPFFNSVLRRLGKNELENKSICTNLMTKYLIPNLLSTNLTYMSRLFKIEHGNAHRALDDAKASANLLLKYLDIFEQKNIEKLNHLYYPRNKYELDRIHLKKSQHSKSNIHQIIKNIKTPFLCSIKGEKGTLDYIIPLMPNKKSFQFLKEKIDLLDKSWEIISIQIFGSFSETYLNFIKYISKLKINDQKIIEEELLQLFEINKKYYEELKRNLKLKPDQTINSTIGSFIVTGHLVEDQYIIYNTQNLNAKNSLIFKYPAHQKKLQQFITSRSNKKANLKNISIHFYSIFICILEKNHESILITKGPISKKVLPEILNEIQINLSKYEYGHHYPQNYI